MKKVKVVVVIPVGPDITYLEDIIDSVLHYVTSSHVIILLDDSGKGIRNSIEEKYKNIVVLQMKGSSGKATGLYLNLAKGFFYAHTNYDFDVILRMDTDALIIGKNPELDAIQYFQENPECGIIGSYMVDCNGEQRDFSKPRAWIEKTRGIDYLLVKKPIKRLREWIFFQKILRRSLKKGYDPGEHCQGGAYFISRNCINRLIQDNLLVRSELEWVSLAEDMIFSLLIYSVGMRLGDFATGSYPMGIRWQGLPCSPEELLSLKKKVIHSTRFYNDFSEREIREYFSKYRMNEKQSV